MLEFLQNLLYAIITASVPVITFYVVKALRVWFSKLAVEIDEYALRNTINDALNIVLSVVTSTSQTYVDSLKKEGKFDEEAQKIAFENTKNTIIELLSDETEELLATLYNDVDKWLDVQIEAAVKQIKSYN